MAETTMYICDICKQSKSKEDLARLEIKANGIHIKGCNTYTPLKIDVCPDCLKKKGFVVETKTEEEVKEAMAKNKLTIEDKIYEILEDMGVAFVE